MAQKVKKKIIQVLLFLSRLLRVYVSPSSRFYDFRWHTRGPFEENLWSDTRGLYLLGMVSLGLCHAFGYLWINTQILVVLLVMLDLFVIHVKVRRVLEVRPNIDVTCYMVTRITGRSRICSKVVAITF